MTVPSQTPKVTHTANGTSKSFAFTFRIRKTSHLAVYVDSTLQTLGTHYSVTSTNLAAGGTVVFVTAPANGAKVRIYRNMPYSRTDFDYQTSGTFPAATINEDLDSLALQVQQIAESVNRSVTVGLFSDGVSTSLPSPSSLKFLRWNSAGNALENADASVGAVLASAVHKAEQQTAAEGQTVFNLTNSYLPGTNSLQVEMNNAILASGIDYTETSATSITLVDPAYADDFLVFKTISFVNSPASDAASVSFTQSGAGSVARNVADVLKERIRAKDKGAVPGTDATTALQNALNSLQPYQVLDLGGVYQISATLTIPVDNICIVNGRLIAAAGTSFEYMIYGVGRSNVKIIDIELDANKANRAGAQNVRFMGGIFVSSTDCGFVRTTARGCRGYGGISAVGLGLSATTRCFVDNCTLVDNGDVGYDSDGVFTSGVQNLIFGSRAYNCTDTAFVIENSDYSVISACESYDCSSPAAVTLAGNDNHKGNVISGITARNWKAPSTGGIQIGCLSGTGNLYDTSVSGVVMNADTGSGYGSGAAVWVRKVGSGKAIGVDLGNLSVNGATYGVRVDDGDNVCLSGATIKGVTSASAYFAAGVDHAVKSSHLQGGDYGILTANAAECDAFGNTIKGQSIGGIVALNNSVINNWMNSFKSITGVRVSKDAGAIINSMTHIGTQPVLTSNVLTNGVAGTLAKKVEVYDHNGASQGFLYLYAT